MLMSQEWMDVSSMSTLKHLPVNSAPSTSQGHSSILLALPLPVTYDEQGQLLIESQAANGLERWADYFDKVTAACIFTPETKLKARSSLTWKRVLELPCANRAEVIPLPWAYRPALLMRHYGKIRKQLRNLIEKSDYLFFGIGYSWGDWASFGCLEAIRRRRSYAVWTDLVDYQVIRFDADKKSLLRRVYSKFIDATIVKYYHHYLIARSGLGSSMAATVSRLMPRSVPILMSFTTFTSNAVMRSRSNGWRGRPTRSGRRAD